MEDEAGEAVLNLKEAALREMAGYHKTGLKTDCQS
jgi:hypothetical protein